MYRNADFFRGWIQVWEIHIILIDVQDLDTYGFQILVGQLSSQGYIEDFRCITFTIQSLRIQAIPASTWMQRRCGLLMYFDSLHSVDSVEWFVDMYPNAKHSCLKAGFVKFGSHNLQICQLPIECIVHAPSNPAVEATNHELLWKCEEESVLNISQALS